ncbi:uncharacterized protein BJ171DRAFT_184013 [Polychytrium aggregatum]|uniref:uncharacterized protein n=1 Tax=Polychytrium aggregatum TaxID=110093 RepID=UPI0022FE871D|nr:uncharacterized protein BJ171DRAFT_184013 [Polychytrium aggregatum]KAI9202384.1 hypothetical protein BJ171DRAFT_184013 [Polychytrium aggregatum]
MGLWESSPVASRSRPSSSGVSARSPLSSCRFRPAAWSFALSFAASARLARSPRCILWSQSWGNGLVRRQPVLRSMFHFHMIASRLSLSGLDTLASPVVPRALVPLVVVVPAACVRPSWPRSSSIILSRLPRLDGPLRCAAQLGRHSPQLDRHIRHSRHAQSTRKRLQLTTRIAHQLVLSASSPQRRRIGSAVGTEWLGL